MSESKATRTLVKSPPELWSEVSNAASLQRHMDQFGEIRITRLEPETAVAWEGEHARGTVRLEPAGWGTKVSLTAARAASDAGAEGPDAAAQEPDPEPEPDSGAAPSLPEPYETVEAEIRELTAFLERSKREAEMRKRRWPRRVARTLRRWFLAEPEEAFAVPSEPMPVASEPEQATGSGAAEPKTASAPEEERPSDSEGPQTAALNAALDSLGQAHHRPFSRA